MKTLQPPRSQSILTARAAVGHLAVALPSDLEGGGGGGDDGGGGGDEHYHEDDCAA